MARIEVHPVSGGWLLVTWEWEPGAMHVAVALRFAVGESGRLVPRAMYMEPDRPIDSGMLRRLSIAGVEAVANRPDIREQILSRIDEKPPDPYELIVAAKTLTDRGSAADTLTVTVTDRVGLSDTVNQVTGRRPSARLTVPTGRAKPDSFYRRVAAVYGRLSAQSNRPAVELAKANDVPLTTAHRWVKEARRRGFLTPGQKGRRG